MLGLHIADIAVLAAFFAGITLLGVWSSNKIKNSADFFMPRKFGKAMMIMFSFGTGTHADQAVSVASKSYTNGFSGIWYQWNGLPTTPFYWLIAPVLRRFRAITTADVFRARFSPSVAVLYAVIGMLNLSCSIGFMLKGSGAVISSSTGAALNPDVVIAVMTVIFVFYGVVGGLSASIITDFIQGILTIVLSFMLLPLILSAIGGMQGLHSALRGTHKLVLFDPSDISVFYITTIAVNGLIGYVTQPGSMGTSGAGKTELEGRVGLLVGNFLKRIVTVPWCLVGVAGAVYFAAKGIETKPDDVFGAVAGDFLPKVTPGILGVFIASLLASVMSACSALMLASAALFTENIYKYFRSDRSQSHYVSVGRITSILVVAGGVIFAYSVDSVVEALELLWMVPPLMGIVFWLGLFWRRTTAAGAWAATLTAFLVLVLSKQTFIGPLHSFVISWVGRLPFADTLQFVTATSKGSQIYLPWQIVFYLSAGFLAGIVVSLFTKPISEERLDDFYALVRTPIRPGEQIPAPCTLPVDAVIPDKRAIFPNTSLEILVPSRSSVIGFLVSWFIVFLMVYLFYLLVGGF